MRVGLSLAMAAAMSVAFTPTANAAAKDGLDRGSSSTSIASPACTLDSGWQQDPTALQATALAIHAKIDCATAHDLSVYVTLTEDDYDTGYYYFEQTPVDESITRYGTTAEVNLRYPSIAPGHSYSLAVGTTVTVPYDVVVDASSPCAVYDQPGSHTIQCNSSWSVLGQTTVPLRAPVVWPPAGTGGDIVTADGARCSVGVHTSLLPHALAFAGEACSDVTWGQAMAFGDRARLTNIAQGPEQLGPGVKSAGKIFPDVPGATYVIDFYARISLTSPVVSLPEGCMVMGSGAACQILLTVKIPK
jgi:hypothetical protein